MFQIQVSLKTIKQSVAKNISDKFLEFLSSIQRMNHPQLIRMYGVVVDIQETIVVSLFINILINNSSNLCITIRHIFAYKQFISETLQNHVQGKNIS